MNRKATRKAHKAHKATRKARKANRKTRNMRRMSGGFQDMQYKSPLVTNMVRY